MRRYAARLMPWFVPGKPGGLPPVQMVTRKNKSEPSSMNPLPSPSLQTLLAPPCQLQQSRKANSKPLRRVGIDQCLMGIAAALSPRSTVTPTTWTNGARPQDALGVDDPAWGSDSEHQSTLPDATSRTQATLPGAAGGSPLGPRERSEFFLHARTRGGTTGRLPDFPLTDFQNTAKTWETMHLSDSVCKRRFGG